MNSECECEICMTSQKIFIGCSICNNKVCEKCYIKIVKVKRTDDNELLFNSKCPFCRDDVDKNNETIDKNALYSLLKVSYKPDNDKLNETIEKQREEIQQLLINRERAVKEAEQLIKISQENQINNMKTALKSANDKYKIFLQIPPENLIKDLKKMGGFYDSSIDRWWIYKDNQNKKTILKTFKQMK